ncbi:hypothetical protein MMC29_000636 [Sticta canariensis]|nr:hypothetical protein [Sticta canariensis]
MSDFRQITMYYLAEKYRNHALFYHKSRRETENSAAKFLATLGPQGTMVLMAGVLAGMTDLNELAQELMTLCKKPEVRWTARHVECGYLLTIGGKQIPEFSAFFFECKRREDGGEQNAWTTFDSAMHNAYEMLNKSTFQPVARFLHDLEAVEFLRNPRFEGGAEPSGWDEDVDDNHYGASGHVRKARRLG